MKTEEAAIGLSYALHLRLSRCETENVAVRGRVRFAGFAAVAFCAWLAGVAPLAGKPAASAVEARVDINRASVEELMKVPGMTATWAGRIVRFRPYRTKLDLLERGVVTSQVYDRIKDSVVAHRDKQSTARNPP